MMFDNGFFNAIMGASAMSQYQHTPQRVHKRRHSKKRMRKRKIARASRKKNYKILGKRG
jgi:tRNA U54 and U55 pseudouridine synthase Pus10